MESYTPPVGPPDPYDRYRVEEIQKDKSGPFNQEPKEPKKEGPLLLYVLSWLRKLFQLFDTPRPKKTPSKGRIHLRLFRAALESLQTEDHSQDILFLDRLSDLWHKLLTDQTAHPRLASWIRSLETYPEGQEPSFGYYLSEYTKDKWIPFPFMEMLCKLHLEHTKDPLRSTLHKWVEQIDSLLPLLV